MTLEHWNHGGGLIRNAHVILHINVARLIVHGQDTSVPFVEKSYAGWYRTAVPFSSPLNMHLFGTIAFGTRVHRKQLALIEEAAKLLHVPRNEVVKRGAVAYARDVIANTPR